MRLRRAMQTPARSHDPVSALTAVCDPIGPALRQQCFTPLEVKPDVLLRIGSMRVCRFFYLHRGRASGDWSRSDVSGTAENACRIRGCESEPWHHSESDRPPGSVDICARTEARRAASSARRVSRLIVITPAMAFRSRAHAALHIAEAITPLSLPSFGFVEADDSGTLGALVTSTSSGGCRPPSHELRMSDLARDSARTSGLGI